jgi:hypothetical protein
MTNECACGCNRICWLCRHGAPAPSAGRGYASGSSGRPNDAAVSRSTSVRWHWGRGGVAVGRQRARRSGLVWLVWCGDGNWGGRWAVVARKQWWLASSGSSQAVVARKQWWLASSGGSQAVGKGAQRWKRAVPPELQSRPVESSEPALPPFPYCVFTSARSVPRGTTAAARSRWTVGTMRRPRGRPACAARARRRVSAVDTRAHALCSSASCRERHSRSAGCFFCCRANQLGGGRRVKRLEPPMRDTLCEGEMGWGGGVGDVINSV